MTGITYLTWRICVGLSIILLAYALIKHPLWIPGMIVQMLASFGSARFVYFRFSPQRAYALRWTHLALYLGAIYFLSISLQKGHNSLADQRTPNRGLSAPGFLVLGIVLMMFRMFVEYAFVAREAYVLNTIELVFLRTFLPCVIVLAHPARSDALQEILRGIALGSALSLMPVIADWRSLVYGLSTLWTSGIIAKVRFAYRYYHWQGLWALEGATAVFYLALLSGSRRKLIGATVVAILAGAFILIIQSWRTFFGLLAIPTLTAIFLLRGTDRHWPRGRTWSIGILVLMGILIYAILFGGWHFERFSIDSLVRQFGPSSEVVASISRGDLSRLAFQYWKEHPILGPGLSGFGWVSREVEPGTGKDISGYIGTHSLLLDLMVQHGLIGLLWGAIFLVWMLRLLSEEIKASSGQRRLELLMLTAFWLGLLVVNLMLGNLVQLGLLALLPCTFHLMRKSSHPQASRAFYSQADSAQLGSRASPALVGRGQHADRSVQ